MLDKTHPLARAFARAQKLTRVNGDCLEWTGTGSAQKLYRQKTGRYAYDRPEPLRCSALGRQIGPRTLFWAVEHGLALEDVPALRCGCGNPLCILPAHMSPPRPQKAPRPPLLRVTPDVVYRLFHVTWTQQQINDALMIDDFDWSSL
jgi:hypothetical protein